MQHLCLIFLLPPTLLWHSEHNCYCHPTYISHMPEDQQAWQSHKRHLPPQLRFYQSYTSVLTMSSKQDSLSPKLSFRFNQCSCSSWLNRLHIGSTLSHTLPLTDFTLCSVLCMLSSRRNVKWVLTAWRSRAAHWKIGFKGFSSGAEGLTQGLYRLSSAMLTWSDPLFVLIWGTSGRLYRTQIWKEWGNNYDTRHRKNRILYMLMLKQMYF